MTNMEKLVFEKDIKAPINHVWNSLWDKTSYKLWTAVFSEGSYYEGELKDGGRIHFLNHDGSGMYSNIDGFIVNEFIRFRHIGEVREFRELPLNEKSNEWSGICESYRLIGNDSFTRLIVEVDSMPDFKDFLQENFPKALETLNQICVK